MKLVDMKYTAKEKADRRKGYESPMKSDGPEYPYGLNITLEHDHLKKLGIKKLPKVGGHIMLHAKAKVTSVSSNDRENGKSDRRVELQLQHLNVGDNEHNSAAEAMDSAIEEANDA